MKPGREIILLELHELPDPHPTPARTVGQRLRSLLKGALRVHGFKCVRLADGAKAEIATRTASECANNGEGVSQ